MACHLPRDLHQAAPLRADLPHLAQCTAHLIGSSRSARRLLVAVTLRQAFSKIFQLLHALAVLLRQEDTPHKPANLHRCRKAICKANSSQAAWRPLLYRRNMCSDSPQINISRRHPQARTVNSPHYSNRPTNWQCSQNNRLRFRQARSLTKRRPDTRLPRRVLAADLIWRLLRCRTLGILLLHSPKEPLQPALDTPQTRLVRRGLHPSSLLRGRPARWLKSPLHHKLRKRKYLIRSRFRRSRSRNNRPSPKINSYLSNRINSRPRIWRDTPNRTDTRQLRKLLACGLP
jgi:hypothetical protein